MRFVMRIGLFWLSVGLAGCGQGPSLAPEAAPIPVTVSHPVEREVIDHADFTGRTAAVDSVEVRARVWGYLDKVHFKEGALVKKDDVQFRDLRQHPFSAFVLGAVLVFFVLAGLYESWSLPLAVILVVPMCVLSAITGVALRGMDNNIFTQVGFVVLIGLACKNAILIVEFARDRQQEGAARFDAVVEAVRVRLRPIVMTTMCFIHMVPPYLATGAGAEMRRSVGTAMLWGAFGVTVFGLFLTPVFYSVVRRLTDRRALKPVLARGRDAVPAIASHDASHARNGKASYAMNGHPHYLTLMTTMLERDQINAGE